MSTASPRTSFPIPVLAALVLVAVLAGCAKTVIPVTPPSGVETPRTELVRQEADLAFKNKDHQRSELLYTRLLDMKGLDPDLEAAALERLAVSALANDHPHVALDALDRLAKAKPDSADAWSWHELRLKVLAAMERDNEADEHLASVARNASSPPDLRNRAGIYLARELWSRGEYAGAMDVLGDIYFRFPKSDGPAWESPRARLEAMLFNELSRTDETSMEALSGLVDQTNRTRFPYTIIQLEQARRLARADGDWRRAWDMLHALAATGDLANPGLVQEIMSPLVSAKGKPATGIILALPLSGPYGEMGWKILRGAGAAQWRLALEGLSLEIRAVNTESPGWLDKIEAVPEDFLLVGGPLQAKNLKLMRQRGLTDRHPVFAFLPRLTDMDEGLDAWRFFPGPKDQVRALVDMAYGKLNIGNLAVLHPDDNFGRLLTSLFWSQANRSGAFVAASGSYPPGEPTKWAPSVSQLLGVVPGPDGEPMPPEPDFRAVFLPDGWTQAQMLVPQFFFYEEDRLLFMGPNLWDAALSRNTDIEARYFRLSVFPGAWWDDNPSPGTAELTKAFESEGLGSPCFWTALGFDFVRFAARMGPQPTAWSARGVSDAARAAAGPAQGIDWSMAPISFDGAGRASQDLFLFTPSSSGPVPASPELMAQRLEKAAQKHQQRLESLANKRLLKELEKRLDELVELNNPEDQNRVPTAEELEIEEQIRVLTDKIEGRSPEDVQPRTMGRPEPSITPEAQASPLPDPAKEPRQ